MQQAGGEQRAFTATWVRATTVGWFLGFLVMFAVIAMGQATGLYAQAMIGIGMGVGVGYWQSRVLRDRLDRPGRWVLVTVVGLGTPFVLWDVSTLIGRASLLSLPLCVVAGGTLVALLQGRLLGAWSRRSVQWVAACAVGWTLPALAIALGDSDVMLPPWDEVAGLVGMFLGGFLLGVATAKPLANALRGKDS